MISVLKQVGRPTRVEITPMDGEVEQIKQINQVEQPTIATGHAPASMALSRIAWEVKESLQEGEDGTQKGEKETSA